MNKCIWYFVGTRWARNLFVLDGSHSNPLEKAYPANPGNGRSRVSSPSAKGTVPTSILPDTCRSDMHNECPV